jgi:hypothetical protein
MPSGSEDLIQSWLRETLEEAAGCNAWPLIGPAADPPYVMFAQAGQADEDTLAADDETVTTGTFTIEVYGTNYADTHETARDIRRALRNFAGSSGDLTIVRVLVTDSKDSDPVFEDGQNRPIAYVVEITVAVSWME